MWPSWTPRTRPREVTETPPFGAGGELLQATNEAHGGMAELQEEWDEERGDPTPQAAAVRQQPGGGRALGAIPGCRRCTPLAPPWELVRNVLKAVVDGPVTHVFIKFLRVGFRNVVDYKATSGYRWHDTALSDDPAIRELQWRRRARWR